MEFFLKVYCLWIVKFLKNWCLWIFLKIWWLGNFSEKFEAYEIPYVEKNRTARWCCSSTDSSLYMMASSLLVLIRYWLVKPGWSTSWMAAAMIAARIWKKFSKIFSKNYFRKIIGKIEQNLLLVIVFRYLLWEPSRKISPKIYKSYENCWEKF